ncbi:MAG: glycoside hydrolase family 78 protein [Fimbriimonadaceae bacterium]|nr:family 78 glycoside hydrolase catalytic domain [Chthonomonadaceae bacterium]MCO5296389.1 glycoside hydrolase family 78 protein [Fimbriimonadaceae bacterium]
MWRVSLPAFLLLAAVSMARAEILVAVTAVDLRCEFRVDPLGIDSLHPRLSWTLRGVKGERGQRQSAYRVLVASTAEILARGKGDLWDSGKVASAEQNNIAYAGAPLRSGQACHWKVQVWDGKAVASWSEPSRWEMGLLHPEDWVGRWINDDRENASTAEGFYGDDPAPLFRKEFDVHGPIRRARLYVTGLGYYEATLNGERIGDRVLDPGWTDPGKRVCYTVYDVTPRPGRFVNPRKLVPGKNCLGILLGNGWYNPLPMKMWGNRNVRDSLDVGRPRVLAQLQIEYFDGTRETVATDESWRVEEGPILRNNVYLGEVVDARREPLGWNTPGFDDSKWHKPALAREPVGPLVSQPQPPIRVTKEWKPIKVTQPKPGVFVYDCGVNFAGWVSVRLDVPAGTEIHFRYGELLHPDGTLNPMTSVAGQIKREGVGGPGAPAVAWQADTYIARGGGETYTPRFTWHGFRYVEITGLAAPLPLEAITAQRLNSDVESVGAFECSNPLLNEIQAMCRRTFLSNIFSVQSDCPHRERFGYGGDIAATSEAFMDNFDMSNLYAKAVRDWSDAARADGMFTDTAPFVGIQYCGVIWAMAHPLLIEQLHHVYGDQRLTEEQYEAAKRWLLLVENQTPGDIVQDGLSDHEGLAPAPAPAMVTPLYYESAKLLAAMASRLGRRDDEAHFQALADRVRAAYNAGFVDASSGKVGPGTQASQAFALATGIVPESARPRVLKALIEAVHAKQDHLSTGILGTKFMLDELSRAGRADLAYKIATQPDFPGWGWMLKNGATTLWEHWEFSDNTFSHNHPMFGSVSEWMMRWLGGIQSESYAVGYDRIVIHPQTVEGLDWVNSSYRSVRGTIVSNWSRSVGHIRFEIEVPVNCRARIVLPAKAAAEVQEEGKPLPAGWGAKVQNGEVEVQVGSGRYTFTVRRGAK